MSETRALIVSAVAALVLGIVGLAAAVLSNSQAILLDGLFNVAFFVTALFTLRVAALLKRPDDARFPYGYLYFEPLINTVKGLLILGVSLFALLDALITLFSGGRALQLGVALVYAAAATAVCALVTLALKRATGASPLVEADIGNWTVNTVISGGVFVAFVVAWMLQSLERDVAAAYVDPVLVGLVVLVSIGVPIRMAGRGLNALLNRAPDDEVTAGIDALVRGGLGDLPMRRLYVRTVRPGRTTYVTVHVLLDPAEATLDVVRADLLRGAVIAALAARHSPVIADIVFTAVEQYAAPTTGFRPAGGGQA